MKKCQKVGHPPNLMQKSGLNAKNISNLEVPKSGTWSSKSGKVLIRASKSGTVPPKVGRLTGMSVGLTGSLFITTDESLE